MWGQCMDSVGTVQGHFRDSAKSVEVQCRDMQGKSSIQAGH